jgi:hypothetical protein
MSHLHYTTPISVKQKLFERREKNLLLLVSLDMRQAFTNLEKHFVASTHRYVIFTIRNQEFSQ